VAVELNHTLLNVKSKHESANFVAEILGLPKPEPLFGYFLVVRTSNGVSLDFIDSDEEIEPQHYAFLVSDAEFDQIFERIRQKSLTYWADPARKEAGRINHHFGGRGVYFTEPSGHFLEVITRPYVED
jgi:hypothetical protein